MKSILIFVTLVFPSILAKDFGDIYLYQSDDKVVAEYLSLKSYSAEEIPMRGGNVRDKLNVIRSHNYRFATGRETYQVGLNEFSDWTDQEFNKTLGFKGAAPKNGFNLVLNGVQVVSTLTGVRPSNNQQGMPDDGILIDHTTNYCCGNVLNQGQCGSCYAFSALQALDQRYCMQCKSSLMYSAPQNIIDCCTGTYGCNGGWMSTATDCVQKAAGIDPESAYKYTAAQGTCAFNPSIAQHKQVTSYVEITSQSEYDIKQQLINGPICIAVYVGRAWQMYKSGVLNGTTACRARETDLNHAVLLMGYGKTVDGVCYWLIKNSWGSNWGESGYIRIACGNCCAGMCFAAGYPIFTCSAAK